MKNAHAGGITPNKMTIGKTVSVVSSVQGSIKSSLNYESIEFSIVPNNFYTYMVVSHFLWCAAPVPGQVCTTRLFFRIDTGYISADHSERRACETPWSKPPSNKAKQQSTPSSKPSKLSKPPSNKTKKQRNSSQQA